MSRPFVLLSVATSVDGYIDDTRAERLLLSNADDFDRVDQVRAESDAIMIGAGTLRADNPRLLVRSKARRDERLAAGKPEFPVKVTVSASGKLDGDLEFWHHGGDKIVYTTDSGRVNLRDQLAGLAEVVPLGATVDFGSLLDDLGSRGIATLVVEGGSSIHTELLSADLADEIHLAIAPVVVGDSNAPRFLKSADYPGGPRHRMQLLESRQVGDVVLLRYNPRQQCGSGS